MYCLLPLITSFFFPVLPPSLLFWPLYLYVSLALVFPSVFQSPHLSLHPISFPLPLHCISLSALLFSCPPILLLFLFCNSPLFTLHNPTPSSLSFLAPLLSDSQSCLVLSAVQYFITMAQPQHDNGHNTQPNSGFKETYRDIMRWLPHWRFTTAKSTGLNTPKIQHMAAFPLVWSCVCEMLLNVYVGDGKCVGLCMHLNAWAWVV